MKMCAQHWDALREAIKTRGLNHLISANGRDAIARTMAELDGKDEPDDFDPLMTATWMIYGKAMEGLGFALLTGDYCPVCEVVRRHPDPCPNGCTPETYERWWIDGPADAVLAEAKERGLL